MEERMKKRKKNNKKVEEIIKKQSSRVEVTRRSHMWFFHTYFPEYVQYPIADFHREMFGITENDDIHTAVFCSFRGSGKSTLMTLSLPIWAILGRLQKKFVVLISQNADQAKLHFRNLRRELESNELLKRDLGPFQELDEWNSCSLVIPKYGAKIIALSRDQRFRGIRHGQYRPDLIICDDVENSESVKTPESRDSTFEWLTREVLPLGNIGKTKTIIVGNLLHHDSLIKRLENLIGNNHMSGVFKKYPLLDENGKASWPGKYTDQNIIEAEKLSVGGGKSWKMEYLLQIVYDNDPVVDESWFEYYDTLPDILRNQGYSFATGVDLAISDKETADFTSMATAKIIGSGKDQRIFVLPNPINERLRFSQILEAAENICKVNEGKLSNKFYIEDTMLQGYVTQQLNDHGIEAVGVPIRGKDKRTRLQLAATYIYNKKVYFPRKGCEKLIQQIIDLGVASHDDLADAFSTLVLGIIENPPNNSQAIFVESNLYNRHNLRIIGHDDEDWAEKEDREMFGLGHRRGWGPGITTSFEMGESGIIRRY